MPSTARAANVEVGEVAFEELDARQVREIRALAGDQAVDDADAVAAARRALRRDAIR